MQPTSSNAGAISRAIALVWLRRDLRLADNPALQAALAAGLAPVLVYIHAPEEESPWAPGAASRWWLHHSLAALDAQLRKRGSQLCLRIGASLAELQALIDETGASGVFWTRAYPAPIVDLKSSRERALAAYAQMRGRN